MTLSTDLIINLAPTGMIPTRDMNPHVPLTPQEIIKDACACIARGASIIHLHARDEDGRPTYKRDIFARIIEGIREHHPEAILCASLSGRDFPEFEHRADPLKLKGDAKPDMASLTLASLNFSRTASVNAPDMVRRLAETMGEAGIRPELEAFDLGMINYALYLVERGVITAPLYFNLLLGNIASAQIAPAHIAAMITSLPAQARFSLGGIGAAQLPANLLGLVHAHGIRTGLEDYLWLDAERTELATNLALVERMVTLATLSGRKIASCASVRQDLGL